MELRYYLFYYFPGLLREGVVPAGVLLQRCFCVLFKGDTFWPLCFTRLFVYCRELKATAAAAVAEKEANRRKSELIGVRKVKKQFITR